MPSTRSGGPPTSRRYTRSLCILLVLFVLSGVVQGLVLDHWSSGVGTIAGALLVLVPATILAKRSG